MRSWAWVRRATALLVTVVFALGVLVAPVYAKSKSFSGGTRRSYSSGGRSFSSPKPSGVPKSTTPRSFSSPSKSSTTTPKRSFSSPSPSYSNPSKSYSTPTSPSYSGGDRSFSGGGRSFSGTKSWPSVTSGEKMTPVPTYDKTKTKHPTKPPVIITGPSTYEPGHWHDWYWGRPWYWRMWHRPVYHGDGRWGISWLTVIAVGVGIWMLLGVISAYSSRRRRR